MKRRIPILILTISVIASLFIACTGPQEQVYYVSVGGFDGNPGTLELPFKTIQRAADIIKAGERCCVLEGIYREKITVKTSGIDKEPIRFESYKNQEVVIDGTETIEGDWELWQGNIYRIRVAESFDQLFCNGSMMIEARWPNMDFPDQLWDNSTRASTGTGSRYGKIIDPDLAASGIDWTGAIATLNVAHQFRTWTRRVLSHEVGQDLFTYKKNISPITSYRDKTVKWEDDNYFLFGNLEALDSPGEWYLDREEKVLYFWPPGEGQLTEHEICYKARYHGFEIDGGEYIELDGFRFFGTTFSLSDCNNCLIENCRLLYPVYTREFNDPDLTQSPVETSISGNYNRFRKNYIAFSQLNGLAISGSENLVENNIIHDVAWEGQGYGIVMNSKGDKGNILTRNTIYNTGYSALRLSGGGNWTASYNHLYNTALKAKDCAVIQTGGWTIRGAEIHHNWVHDCYAQGNHPGGLKGGLGIRGDDQTREVTVHHNVVWNCGRDGIIVKGDDNLVYHNTVFNIGSNGLEGNYISMHTEKEPLKPWRDQAPLLEIQNINSKVFNNAALIISGDRKRNPFTPAENLFTNYCEKELNLSDPDNFDLSPAMGSPLIDAGTYTAEIENEFKGDAPDIGAYEFGDNWKAGADWSPDKKPN